MKQTRINQQTKKNKIVSLTQTHLEQKILNVNYKQTKLSLTNQQPMNQLRIYLLQNHFSTKNSKTQIKINFRILYLMNQQMQLMNQENLINKVKKQLLTISSRIKQSQMNYTKIYSLQQKLQQNRKTNLDLQFINKINLLLNQLIRLNQQIMQINVNSKKFFLKQQINIFKTLTLRIDTIYFFLLNIIMKRRQFAVRKYNFENSNSSENTNNEDEPIASLPKQIKVFKENMDDVISPRIINSLIENQEHVQELNSDSSSKVCKRKFEVNEKFPRDVQNTVQERLEEQDSFDNKMLKKNIIKSKDLANDKFPQLVTNELAEQPLPLEKHLPKKEKLLINEEFPKILFNELYDKPKSLEKHKYTNQKRRMSNPNADQYPQLLSNELCDKINPLYPKQTTSKSSSISGKMFQINERFPALVQNELLDHPEKLLRQSTKKHSQFMTNITYPKFTQMSEISDNPATLPNIIKNKKIFDKDINFPNVVENEFVDKTNSLPSNKKKNNRSNTISAINDIQHSKYFKTDALIESKSKSKHKNQFLIQSLNYLSLDNNVQGDINKIEKSSLNQSGQSNDQDLNSLLNEMKQKNKELETDSANVHSNSETSPRMQDIQQDQININKQEDKENLAINEINVNPEFQIDFTTFLINLQGPLNNKQHLQNIIDTLKISNKDFIISQILQVLLNKAQDNNILDNINMEQFENSNQDKHFIEQVFIFLNQFFLQDSQLDFEYLFFQQVTFKIDAIPEETKQLINYYCETKYKSTHPVYILAKVNQDVQYLTKIQVDIAKNPLKFIILFLKTHKVLHQKRLSQIYLILQQIFLKEKMFCLTLLCSILSDEFDKNIITELLENQPEMVVVFEIYYFLKKLQNTDFDKNLELYSIFYKYFIRNAYILTDYVESDINQKNITQQAYEYIEIIQKNHNKLYDNNNENFSKDLKAIKDKIVKQMTRQETKKEGTGWMSIFKD